MDRRFAIVAVALFAATAAMAAADSISERMAETGHTIYVVSNGWHTNIVLARHDIPLERIPEALDFPDSRYFEFGWGDAEYYPAEETTLGMALRAGLTPTPAVVHVVGAFRDPVRRYSSAEVISLSLDAARLARLVEFIHAAFERGDEGRAMATGPGLYANSRFYPATGRFYLGNTCNTWTARALDSAGFAVNAAKASRAEDVMRQLRPLAMPP